MIRIVFISTIALIPFAAVGCGGGVSDAPTLATVSGKVTVDGKPQGGLTVEFQPTKETPGPLSTGITSEDGSFTLSTATGRGGAVVGKHKVLVKCPWRLEGRSAAPTADGFGSSEDGSAPPAARQEGPECTVNIKFESAETTTLTADVPAEGVSDIFLQVTTK